MSTEHLLLTLLALAAIVEADIPAGYNLKNIQANVRSPRSSPIVLRMIDVMGNDIAGDKAERGDTIRLRATFSGPERGIRPESCDAIDSSNSSRHAILRGGCGDGVVLNQHQGFTTDGNTTTSPTFSINTEQTFKFQCSFSLCDPGCDGNSCTNARRRRVTKRWMDWQ